VQGLGTPGPGPRIYTHRDDHDFGVNVVVRLCNVTHVREKRKWCMFHANGRGCLYTATMFG
jgi:hypothetical protein